MPDTPDDRINVLVAMDFPERLLEEIRSVSPRLNVVQHYPDVPAGVWGDIEVLYTLKHYPEPEQVPLLRWIQLHYAGMDNAIEQRIIQAEDIVVTSASGIHARQMAQYSLLLILAFHYQLPTMLQFQQEAIWHRDRYKIFSPQPLRTQTVGIVGYGSIGRETARLCKEVGMNVLATKRDIKNPQESDDDYTPQNTGDPGGEIPERIYPVSALATMVAECDYVVIATPLTDETHHLINEDIFHAMKPSAILINVARGEVVDETALITALSSGDIGGAGLDVFEVEPLPSGSPLWQLDNVIISPHVSGNSASYHDLAAALFIANLERYLHKQPLMNRLDRQRGY